MDSDLQEGWSEVEPTSQQGLKSSLEHMSVETLKVLCQAEGLLEIETKRELVVRLVGRVVSKVKGKGRAKGSSQDRDMWDERLSFESNDIIQD
ncbi:10927_t:CDS:1, partial [Scutellospora calospora]